MGAVPGPIALDEDMVHDPGRPEAEGLRFGRLLGNLAERHGPPRSGLHGSERDPD